jgi:hypothetical protein
VEDIKQIEQHKYHPKETDVEYYSNHMIYKNDEHRPRKDNDIDNILRINFPN